jgi:hypothetical protein
MPGDVEFLEVARRARTPAPVHAAAAASYLRRAEDALALLPHLSDHDDRAAVCTITETWLSLAEAQLAKQSDLR